eukprot:PhM_4_TR635/c0_g1_i1/m.86463/K17943/PUM; pumilio RNA-binding family
MSVSITSTAKPTGPNNNNSTTTSSKFELSAAERPEGTSALYVLVSNCTLEDMMRGMNIGIFHMNADPALIQKITESHQERNLVTVIMLYNDITVGYAHMLSRIIPRHELPEEHQQQDIPRSWAHLYKCKWMRVSAIPVDVFASLRIEDGNSMNLNNNNINSNNNNGAAVSVASERDIFQRPPVCILPHQSGVVICNMLDEAVAPHRRSANSYFPKSISRYATYDEYVEAMRDGGGEGGSTGGGGGAGLNPKGGKQSREAIAMMREAQQLLSKFHATRNERVWRPVDVKGFMPVLCRDNDGLTLMMYLLDTFSTSAPDLLDIVNEVKSHLPVLMRDPVGHQFCIRLLEKCKAHPSVMKQVATSLKAAVTDAATHTHASKVLTVALDVFPAPGREMIAQELSPSIEAVIQDIHGSHIVQKLLAVHPKAAMVVTRAVCRDITTYVQHVHGSYVLKALLDTLPAASPELKDIYHEVVANITSFILDNSANYIVQSLITHETLGRGFVSSLVAELMQGDTFLMMCTHKCGSNVAETLIRHASPQELTLIINHCFTADGGDNSGSKTPASTESSGAEGSKKPSSLMSIIVDDTFGNYVVQKMVDVANKEQLARLKEHFQTHCDGLTGRHSKHLVPVLEKKLKAMSRE